MESNKERQLSERICKLRPGIERDCLVAELAIVHCRQGKFAIARESLLELRQINRDAPSIKRSIWTHLVDGLLDYFEGIGQSRSDGVGRAFAIGKASENLELVAISAAWLAQIDYSVQNMEGAGANLRLALKASSVGNHAARSRTYLVGAQALHYGGRPDLAKPWYAKSHSHAVSDGDELTIGAIMHNMAWLRMLNFRQAVLSDGDGFDVGRHALMSAESTASFEDVTGDTSWIGLRSVLRAQIFSLNGDFFRALEIYQNRVGDEDVTSRLQANLLADEAWCLAMSGKFDLAMECAGRSLQGLSDDVHVDDRAATHSRLSSVFSKIGDRRAAKIHHDLAKNSWSKHISVQKRAVASVIDIELPLDEIV